MRDSNRTQIFLIHADSFSSKEKSVLICVHQRVSAFFFLLYHNRADYGMIPVVVNDLSNSVLEAAYART